MCVCVCVYVCVYVYVCVVVCGCVYDEKKNMDLKNCTRTKLFIHTCIVQSCMSEIAKMQRRQQQQQQQLKEPSPPRLPRRLPPLHALNQTGIPPTSHQNHWVEAWYMDVVHPHAQQPQVSARTEIPNAMFHDNYGGDQQMQEDNVIRALPRLSYHHPRASRAHMVRVIAKEETNS